MGACCDDEHSEFREATIHPEAPQFSELIDRCRADEYDCWALCDKVYDQIYGPNASDWANYTCNVEFDAEGQAVVGVTTYWGGDCDDGVVEGRRPPGLNEAIFSSATEAGLWLAKMARLEEASVYAFLFLATELEHHGAPDALVEAARQSALDEIRHARSMAALALRYGATPPRAVVDLPRQPRSLREIAVENATEGCVRETFGALVALHQSHAAEDSFVRRIMSGIAADELRHSELSWDIDRWVRRSQPDLRGALDIARALALRALQSELGAGPSDKVCMQLGLPSATVSHAMLHDARERRVWA